MARVCIYHDFASPYSYLGSTQIEALVARQGATLQWVPMVLGAVFKAVGQDNVPMLSFPASKRRVYLLDMMRFADHYGVPFRFPTRFPIRTIDALRWVLAAEEQSATAAAALTHRIYRAYWGEDRDIADAGLLGELAAGAGLDATRLLARVQAPEIKTRLFANTDEAIERGVFGAPTFILDDGTLFWGQDRLPLLERALGARAGQ